MESADALARAAAALRALAVGDAMGRATELYDPAEIEDIYEEAITEFVEPVRLFDDEEWAAGETGQPTQIALEAATGASRADDEPAHADRIEQLPRAVTLGLMRPLTDVLATRWASGPSLAVAVAVSAAMEGHPAREALTVAARAAGAAGDERLGERIAQAGGIAQASGGRRPGAALREVFPPGSDAGMLVPFVLGLVYATQSARRAILEAINQGGHAPESAGIAGAICAAIVPISLPPAWAAEVERINEQQLDLTARRCLAARGAAAIE